MTTKQRKPGIGRLQLLSIAAVFIVPLALAAWLYYSDTSLVPDSGTNNGALLLPIISLRDEMPASTLHDVQLNHWLAECCCTVIQRPIQWILMSSTQAL